MDRQAVSRSRIDKKPLADRALRMTGISAETIRQHFKLYESYVDRVNDVRGELGLVDLTTVNSAFSPYHNLKRAEAIALNAVKLHELYFEQLGGAGGRPAGAIRELIERAFCSVDDWIAEFTACAKASGGWVILAWDLDDQYLFHFITDSQTEGNIVQSTVILALDVYEHAYSMDYENNREKYVNAFLNNIDWEIINRRAVEAKRSKRKIKWLWKWLTLIISKIKLYPRAEEG